MLGLPWGEEGVKSAAAPGSAAVAQALRVLGNNPWSLQLLEAPKGSVSVSLLKIGFASR